MYYRTIASWLRRRGVLTLPVVIAALGFAGTARATSASVVFTPTTTAQLESDVTAADAEPAGTLSIIQLSQVDYQPTSTLVLSGNIEITGPPALQEGYGTSTGQQPEIDGTQIPTSTPQDVISISSGANVLFKAFGLDFGGVANSVSFAGAEVHSGATLEADNMELNAGLGVAIAVDSGGAATISNSTGDTGSEPFIAATGPSTTPTWLINDTFADAGNGAIIQSANAQVGAINSMLVNNETVSTTAHECSIPLVAGSTNDQIDDTSCGTTGVTQVTAAQEALQGDGLYGGPTNSDPPAATAPAIGAADAADCPNYDQRFYPRTASTCDVGAFQSTGTTNEGGLGVAPAQTTGPSCAVTSKNQTVLPQTETVSATDTGIGLGPDAIAYFTPSGSTYPIPTNNGTVSYGTVGSTWFAKTMASPPVAQEGDFASNSPLAVTATKPATDAALNDTQWSFDATNWLGITTYCK
jgi:hypothetical protein